MSEDKPTLNVYQRKLAVMRRCSEIAPDKTHPHHKYDYVSIQNISNHMRKFLVEEGMDVEFSFEASDFGDRVVVTLVNVDKPEDRIVTFWPIVPDDKGYAYTTKFPLIRMFQIGDGEEGDESELATKSGQAANRRVEGVGPTPVATPSTRPTSTLPPSRGQAAPGPTPSTPTPSPVRGPAPAPVPGTPRTSGNMLTLTRPAKPAEAKEDVVDADARDVGLRTEALSLAMTAAQQMSPGMTEMQAFAAAEKYLDKLSQQNWGKDYKDATELQVRGLIVFFKEKFKPESA